MTWRLGRSLLLAAIVGSGALEGQQPPKNRNVRLDDLHFVVVPVSVGNPPYAADYLYRRFSAGDTLPGWYRIKPGIGYCASEPFFLRRSALTHYHTPCDAANVLPWLVIPRRATVPDLAARALAHADSMAPMWLKMYKPYVLPLVIVVPAAGLPDVSVVQVPIPDSLGVPVRKRVVVHTVTSDSTALSERVFIDALLVGLGAGRQAIVADSSGTTFLHPDARAQLTIVVVVPFPDSGRVALDTEVRSCGSLPCAHFYPIYRVAARGGAEGGTYVTSEPGKGVLIERVGPMCDRDCEPPTPVVRVMLKPGSAPFALTAGTAPVDTILTVQWRGEVADVFVHQGSSVHSHDGAADPK